MSDRNPIEDVRVELRPGFCAWTGQTGAGKTLLLEARGLLLGERGSAERLRDDIGIPRRLRDLGVSEKQLRPFAEKAFGIRHILRVNPRPVTVDDLEGIYRAAF
jgi:hypothetical protein